MSVDARLGTQRCGSTRELRLREQLVPGGGRLVGGDTFEEAGCGGRRKLRL